MIRFVIVGLFVVHLAEGQVCRINNPCINGDCIEETNGRRAYKCECKEGWAGIHCNLPQPEVICGERAIEIFIDDRIVTEQRLSSDLTLVQFWDSPRCSAQKRAGSYYFKVNMPFKECGIRVKHEGDDYTFSQQVVWNSVSETVQRPLILLEFECTYEDKYVVSFGGITPTEVAVDFKTRYGKFKVGMALFSSRNFNEENRYGERSVLSVNDDVCVSTELKNVMPRDLVLTNRDCWASSNRNGSGERHALVSSKCVSDPTTEMLSNGEGDSARFCFQVFKWRNSDQAFYTHCAINVCNATAGETYCQCEKNRTRRFIRSAPTIRDGTILTWGPMYLQHNSDEALSANGKDSSSRITYTHPGKKADGHTYDNSSKTKFFIAVVVILISVVIFVGVVALVYVTYTRKSVDSKETMRNDGEPVILPDPVTVNSMVE